VALKQGKLDTSRINFSRSYRSIPAYIPAEYQLGYVRLQMHQADAAMPLLQDVVSRQPNHSMLIMSWGRRCLEQGKVKDAIQDLGKLDPPAPDRLRLLSAQRRLPARRARQRRRPGHSHVSETQAQAPSAAAVTGKRWKGPASMKRFVVQITVLVVLAGALVAQQPSPPPEEPGLVVRVTTRMVQVDTVVLDKEGIRSRA